MKKLIKRTPILGTLARKLYWALGPRPAPRQPFHGSKAYWEQRYAAGGDSGDGSYGKLARFKAEVINGFVAAHGVASVIELGCGDGHQLKLAQYPRYLGFDVSATVIDKCRQVFAGDATKAFALMDDYAGERADLTLSLDVVYHVTEDEAYERYMRTLFGAAERFVMIYSSDAEEDELPHGEHVRHRKVTRWIEGHMPEWILLEHIPNRYPYRGGSSMEGSFADFFIYRRVSSMTAAAAP